jgi:hypothetical protein
MMPPPSRSTAGDWFQHGKLSTKITATRLAIGGLTDPGS